MACGAVQNLGGRSAVSPAPVAPIVDLVYSLFSRAHQVSNFVGPPTAEPRCKTRGPPDR